MESSIEQAVAKELALLESNWQRLEAGIGLDLEASAHAHHAIQRAREIKSGRDLLRVGMVFGLQEWSYAQIAGWIEMVGMGELSGPAVRQRLLHLEDWLRWLIGELLRQRCGTLGCQPGWKVRVQDATTVSRPGSTGTDARVHLELDLVNLCIRDVHISDAKTGESLAHFPAAGDEIRVADRGYAFASGMGPVLDQGYLVVRSNWQNLPLLTPTGERFDLLAWLERLDRPAEIPVQLDTPQGRFTLRLLAAPLSADKAEAARRRARRNAEKKGRQVSAGTLLAAGFLLLLTNLPAALWPMELVFWLYRLRWQIELQFKRYKSLLQLAQLRVLDPTMIQICLLCKLLAILLLEQLIFQVRLQQPDWFANPTRPVNIWSLTKLLWEGLRNLLCPSISLERIFACLPKLERHLRSAPRKRQNQLAWALALLA